MAHSKPLMGEKAAKAELASVGIDIDNLDWSKVFQIIQAIVSLFSARKPVMAANGHGDDNEMIKAHFDAIAALAACGSQCCEQG